MRICRVTSMCLCAALTCAPALAQTPQLQLPAGIAYDAAGNLYVADTNRNQVLEATIAGTLVIVAGTGTQGFAGDNGPATTAELNAPQGIAIGPDGTLYITDTGNHRIRTIVAGQITTIAGTGIAGFSGDGGSAIAAMFRSPTALSLDPTGALLICDTGNHRIRRIVSGTVTTVAGSGTQGFAGDNGPATAAELDTPLGIAAFGAGAFYIADTHNDRIRAVGLDGTIHTIAGTGVRGFSGDGDPATQARLDMPGSLVLTTGGLVFSDTNNQRLRLIDSSGTMHTIAGSGTEGKAADGDMALGATIDTPDGTALSPFGMAAFVDSANRMLRVVVNNQLFVPAAFAPNRISAISTMPTASEVYGTAALALSVSGAVGTPQGTLQLLENSTTLASDTLANGSTLLSLQTLTAGQHSLTATYLGDGLNPAAKANATLNIAQAASTTFESTPIQNAYAGLPLTLTAQVATTTNGEPTGTVQFNEGTSQIATGQLSTGSAMGVYLTPSAGTHIIKAVYGGDTNFLPSSSSTVSVVVQAMPDFVLTSTAPSQSVQGGSIATYPITIAAQPGPFSGGVTMSASGLPTGATASFSPAQVVPGSGSTTVQMSILTQVAATRCGPMMFGDRPSQAALFVLALLFLNLRKRSRSIKFVLSSCLSVGFIAGLGCSSRTVAAPDVTPTSYAITVIGTSTNLAGTVVVHTTLVQLTVR